MKFKMKSLPFAVACALASGALMGSAPAMAQAQGEGAGPQRVTVTGSLISRTGTETPTPVQVLTAADIQKSGKTSVAELLTDLAANGAGTLGTGFAGAFANGASGISLRGLTVGATLVLIDGHRMAGYPLSDDAQRQFVDVSSIPFDAIESIEVLKSGASSLYGSDAIAGVVNIKLKKNLTGTRLSAEYGDTQHGGGATRRASISSGIGDIDADGYNAFVTLETRKQSAIKVYEREQFGYANRDWRSRGGNNINLGVPSTNVNSNLTATNSPFLYNPAGTNPSDNPANFVFLDPSKCNFQLYRAGGCQVNDRESNIQPETENVNLLVGMTKKLSDNWEVAFKGSIFQRESENNRNAAPQAYNPTAFNGYNVVNNGQVTPAVGAIRSTLFAPGAQVGANFTNPFAQGARLYGYIPDIGPTLRTYNKSTTSRVSADLTGSAYGWDVSAATGWTKVKVDAEYSGNINRQALYSALANGTWNVLGGNSPELVNAVAPTFGNKLESTLSYVDLVGSRELLPSFGAGPLAFAAGVHWHKREQNAPPSSLTANGAVNNTSAFVIGDETNSAVFAELRATPITNVELGLSSRYDHYDTYGNSFTPAANFKWTPVQNFGVRGTFARGFRAPNPAEVGNAGSSFTFNAIRDPINCANGGGVRTAAGNVPTACSFAPPYLQTTNPNLEPEKSKSYTLGVIYEPMRGLNMTLDYYKIKIENLVVTRAGNDPSFVPVWVRGPIAPIDISTGVGSATAVGLPLAGPILYAESPYINAGSTETHGIEADVRYRWRLANDMGTVSAALSAAHVFGYKTTVAGETYQLAGTQGPSSVGGATGNPKDRAQFTIGYNRGPLDVTATVNYTSGISTFDPALGETDCLTTAEHVGGRSYFVGLPQPLEYCNVSSFTSTNLNIQYRLSENLTLRGAILNLFDKAAPYDVATYGNSGAGTSYNASLHQAGAIGRFFSLGANYTF